MVQNDPVHAGIPGSILSGIAGVAVGTLNVWVARGLIPDVSTGTQGRARLFDLDTAIHVTIMTALVRQGYPAPVAADVASSVRRRGLNNRGKMAIRRVSSQDFVWWEGPSLSELDRALTDFGDEHPEVFTMVEMDRIVERVRTAFIDPVFVPKAAFLDPDFDPDC